MQKSVAVIGAGASGLMAAYHAGIQGAKVTLFDKNEKCGKKIYITGKGRCNITNAVSIEEYLEKVVSNRRFLMKSIYNFSPMEVMQFLEEGGLALKVERGNRVFPLSDKASDLIKCLEQYCRRAGVDLQLNTAIVDIRPVQDKIKNFWQVVLASGAKIQFDAVIVATGGLSYPGTGSTGDGMHFAKKLGHTIIECRPALCGLNCKMDNLKSLQGLALKNVSLHAVYKNGKKISSLFGEMLFTHFGISGPIVLSMSSLLNRLDTSNIALFIDLKPAMTIEEVDKRFLKEFTLGKNKKIETILEYLLPKSLVPVFLQRVGIDAYIPTHSITKEQRKKLVYIMKNFDVQFLALRSIAESIVTAGGVAIQEIDPKSMQSKLHKNLFFCGEVLDVDCFTGGFNLQAAFATGKAAGWHSAINLKE